MTAPKTGENVCRRTPSQSAHVPILATLVDDALADVEDHSADYVDQPMTTTHQVASGQTGHAESRMDPTPRRSHYRVLMSAAEVDLMSDSWPHMMATSRHWSSSDVTLCHRGTRRR
jgi:hypothetical protein